MATYLHFAPAIALTLVIGPRRVGWRLMLAGVVCALLPDADVLMIRLEMDSYSGTYGHRGFTHSVGFALLMGWFGAALARLSSPGICWLTAVFLALCTISHSLIDGLLARGICNAWLWPLDGTRYCLPWRPITLQGTPLFGADRLVQELLWIGLPLVLLTLVGLPLRKYVLARSQARASGQTGALEATG